MMTRQARLAGRVRRGEAKLYSRALGRDTHRRMSESMLGLSGGAESLKLLYVSKSFLISVGFVDTPRRRVLDASS